MVRRNGRGEHYCKPNEVTNYKYGVYILMRLLLLNLTNRWGIYQTKDLSNIKFLYYPYRRALL